MGTNTALARLSSPLRWPAAALPLPRDMRRRCSARRRSAPCSSTPADARSISSRRTPGRRARVTGSAPPSGRRFSRRGAPASGTGLKKGLLATAKRKDGKLQVVYAGHPLYFFGADARAGRRTERASCTSAARGSPSARRQGGQAGSRAAARAVSRRPGRQRHGRLRAIGPSERNRLREATQRCSPRASAACARARRCRRRRRG